MTDTLNTPASPDEEPTAAELAAAGTMRPIEQLPSPWIVKGNPAVISAPTLEALSQADRQTVLSSAGTNDPKAVEAALHGFLKDRQRDLRIRCGPGEGATETERTAMSQINQTRLLVEEYHKLQSELAEVREHRTEVDANGNAVAVPVYVLQGSLRTAREVRMDEITKQTALIAGIQGEAELKEAARVDALRIRKTRQDVADVREIERRAHEMVRNERLDNAAKTKAKFLRGNLG